jgi:8-oxo-dGTP pyrophosphatase MutT (NUDIX family)
MAGDSPIIRVISHLHASVTAGHWAWALDNKAAIAAHWAKLTADKPALYNGRVLLRAAQRFEGETLHLAYRQTDYASFLTLRDMDWPDAGTGNAFAMAALRSADGAFILGEMASHTANAGQVYFAAGTPDTGDVTHDSRVDLEGSVWRELAEETGLARDDVQDQGRWVAVIVGPRTALMREMISPLMASELLVQIRANLSRQDQPELADIHALHNLHGRSEQALLARMPAFMQAYLIDKLAG